jgi:hypothetical protein
LALLRKGRFVVEFSITAAFPRRASAMPFPPAGIHVNGLYQDR